jgi:hypothetical protein
MKARLPESFLLKRGKNEHPLHKTSEASAIGNHLETARPGYFMRASLFSAVEKTSGHLVLLGFHDSFGHALDRVYGIGPDMFRCGQGTLGRFHERSIWANEKFVATPTNNTRMDDLFRICSLRRL